MKKAYIMPLAEVVKTETKELICVTSPSLDIIDDSYDSSSNAGVFGKDDFENVFENLW